MRKLRVIESNGMTHSEQKRGRGNELTTGGKDPRPSSSAREEGRHTFTPLDGAGEEGGTPPFNERGKAAKKPFFHSGKRRPEKRAVEEHSEEKAALEKTMRGRRPRTFQR